MNPPASPNPSSQRDRSQEEDSVWHGIQSLHRRRRSGPEHHPPPRPPATTAAESSVVSHFMMRSSSTSAASHSNAQLPLTGRRGTAGSPRRSALQRLCKYCFPRLGLVVLVCYVGSFLWMQNQVLLQDANNFSGQQRLLHNIPFGMESLRGVNVTALPAHMLQVTAETTSGATRHLQRGGSGASDPESVLQREQWQKMHDKQAQRRQRTRPPPQTATLLREAVSPSRASSTDSFRPVHVPAWDTNKKHPKSAMTEPSPDWAKLCRDAGLDSSSRVVITNALSQPAASAAALLFATQCNVKHVAGADALFPNLRSTRMRFMQVLRKLMQQIPGYQSVVVATGLSKRVPGSLSEPMLLDSTWLDGWKPTHILLMETPVTPFTKMQIDMVMSNSSQSLYELQTHRDTWTDLLQSLLRQKHKWEDDKKHTHLLPRIVHVNSVDHTLVNTMHQNVANTLPLLLSTLRIATVALPRLYGPWVTDLNDPLWGGNATWGTPGEFVPEDAPYLYVDDAMTAILTAFNVLVKPPPAPKIAQLQIPASRLVAFSKLTHSLKVPTASSAAVQQTLGWKYRLQYPFGPPTGSRHPATKAPPHGSFRFADLYGLRPTSMPCASFCPTPGNKCTASVFDAAVSVSRNATAGCTYVMYMGNFDRGLESLFVPLAPLPDQLCRVAFVSRDAPVTKKALIGKKNAQAYNGQMEVDGWKLVWLNVKGNDDDLTDGDAAILAIDPSRLFAPSVRKVMISSISAFAGAPDNKVLSVLTQVDRPAVAEGERSFSQRRDGTDLKRWVKLPAEAERRVLLFGGTPAEQDMPKRLTDYVNNLQDPKQIPTKQLAYYKQVSHWVHVNEFRPEFEIVRTVYKSFPFEWTSDYFMIHDLTTDEGRNLRCEWMQEYLAWGNNRKVRDLSLAYFLGEQRTLRFIGHRAEDSIDYGWAPFLMPSRDEEDEEVIRRVVGSHDDKDSTPQVYLRLLQPRPVASKEKTQSEAED